MSEVGSDETIKALRARIETLLREDMGKAGSPIGAVYRGGRSTELEIDLADGTAVANIAIRVAMLPPGAVVIRREGGEG